MPAQPPHCTGYCYLMRQCILLKWQRHTLVLYGSSSLLMLLMHVCMRLVFYNGQMYILVSCSFDDITSGITIGIAVAGSIQDFKGTLRRRLSYGYFSFIAKYTSS